MADKSQDKLYSTTLQKIGAVSKLPVVRVDREAVLRKQFAGSPHLDVILERGPQAVFTTESLRQKANGIIKSSTAKTSLSSVAAGLPGNPAIMIAAGGADVVQYFGFAINLAQQTAYLFGDRIPWRHVRCGRGGSARIPGLQGRGSQSRQEGRRSSTQQDSLGR